MSKKLSVLVIEDDEDDAKQNIRYLQEAGYEIHSVRVETEHEMRSAMAGQKWDLILSDYLMPRFSVPAALSIYKESGCDIPFIVISGAIGDKKAVSMMKAGAHDYFLKDNMTRFVTAVERELREAAIRKEKKWAQQNLLIQHTLSLKLNRTNDLGMALNEVIETMHGVEGVDSSSIYLNNHRTGTLELFPGKEVSSLEAILPLHFDRDSDFMNKVLEGRPVYGTFDEICSLFNITPGQDEFLSYGVLPVMLDGQCFGALFCASVHADEFHFGSKLTIESIASQIGGTIARVVAEKQLIHAARMAGLGELASGIAHEINQPLNTISLIMDNILAEAGRDDSMDGHYLKNKSDKIFENITRMRNIIDHIRAFSRSQDDYISTRFDLNSSIRNAASMISEQFRHLGIALNLETDEQLPEITGNTFKFEEVILNLLANARDAVLEKGHRVTGSQGHRDDEDFEMKIGIRSFREKNHIIVEVNDNGIGIKDEDLDRIMLPFYTTKESGKGTGLGLSISYQIIRDMGGRIGISSKVLTGTTVKISLPAYGVV